MLNRQVVLKQHPQGIPLPEDFALDEGAIAQQSVVVRGACVQPARSAIAAAPQRRGQRWQRIRGCISSRGASAVDI